MLKPHRAIPECVSVSPGVKAAGYLVELLRAYVVLDDVHGGALFDVHALICARCKRVVTDEVVVALIRPVGPLCAGSSDVDGFADYSIEGELEVIDTAIVYHVVGDDRVRHRVSHAHALIAASERKVGGSGWRMLMYFAWVHAQHQFEFTEMRHRLR